MRCDAERTSCVCLNERRPRPPEQTFRTYFCIEELANSAKRREAERLYQQQAGEMSSVKDKVSRAVDEVQRQVRVTVGRRLSSDSSARPPQPLPRPAGTQGLVVEDDDEDGFSVVERRAPAPRVVRQASEEQARVTMSGPYLIGGDGAGDEEDGACSCCRP